MPVIDVRVLSQGATTVLLPETGKLAITAVVAGGPRTRVTADGVIFSRTTVIDVVNGRPIRGINLDPTDGGYCFEWRITTTVGGFKLVRYTEIPDVDGPVSLSALQEVDRQTFQPTPEVLAAWDTVRAATFTARDESVAAAGRAEKAAGDADTHAGDASRAAERSAGSARDADTSSRDASGSVEAASRHAADASQSATDASGSASTADRRATDADTSAKAAAESERKSDLSAKAAGTSETNAKASERNAATSASETAESARTAAGSATDAGKAKTDTEKLKGDVEKVVQTATFLFVQQGDQPAGVLNLADVKTNALIHRRLTGNITGITLPTTPTPGQMITLVLTQDATGARTLTTPAAIFGHEGMDPTLSTLPNSVDMIGLLYDGVRWWAMVPAQRGS